MMTRKDCIESVRGPGKFEGEAVYVPYFWEIYLNGGVDRDLFPELKGRRTVRLVERDDGFVVEV